MSLSVTCPSCQTKLRVREELAGTEVKCPRCAVAVSVPAAELEEAPLEAVQAAAPTPQRAAAVPTRPCPECGQRISTTARKCRHCGAFLEDEDADGPPEVVSSPYVPCPRCHAPGPEKVIFTFWGSFYGPALFHHVKCLECGYKYNGKTGGSNLHWAIIFVTVPAILLLLIFGCVGFMIFAPRGR